MSKKLEQSDSDSPRAPQVCWHCKSIKKGCDKKLPSCSQCIKRKAVCRYGEPGEGSEKGKATETLAQNWSSIPRSTRAKLNPSIRLSLLLMTALSDALTPHALDPQGSASTDSVFHSQVCQIIQADGRYIDDVVRKYFAGIHLWLPIISGKRFRYRLGQFQMLPTADFSILLLSMQLITQHPSLDPDASQDREVLYLATKTIFAQVQAFIPSSLYLVQAGIILAHYEHAHGMVEAAYVTIGTSARMAFAMGLHNRHCSVEPQGSDAWINDEEVLCTWWGLVICDRIIGIDPQMYGRPLATRQIRDNDYLPLESDDLDDEHGAFSEPKLRYFVSSTSLPGIGTFGREAQAAYLLDKVTWAIEEGRTDPFTLYPLGNELQALLRTVMDQAGGRWGKYCGATQLLITALYTLHQTAALKPDIGSHPGYKETVEGALSSMTRMVLDISAAFNRECGTIDIEILCPAMSHIVRCAQHHIMTVEDFNDPQWMEDFENLRRTLTFFNRRWTLAGMELHRLNETMEVSMALRI